MDDDVMADENKELREDIQILAEFIFSEFPSGSYVHDTASDIVKKWDI